MVFLYTEGCMKDIRLNGYSMPLFLWESNEVASISERSLSLIDGCRDENMCELQNQTSLCSLPFVCVNQWRKTACSLAFV